MKSEQSTSSSEVQNVQIKNDEEFKTVPGPFDQKEAKKEENEEAKETKKSEKK